MNWRSAWLLSVFVPLVLIQIYLAFRRVEVVANRFLCAFLTVFCLNLIPQIIGFAGAYQAWPNLTFAPFNLELLLGPCLLAHIHFLTAERVSGRLKAMFLPGLVQFSYYSVAFLAFDDYRDKWAYNDAFHEPFIVPLEAALTIIVTLLCLWLCWKKIAQYQTYLTENFSSITEFEPTWIKGFLLSVIVLCLVWLGFEVYTQVAELSYVQQYPFFVVLSLIMIWFGLTAVSRTSVEYPKMKFVRADVDEAVEPSSETDSEPVKRSMDWSALGTQYAKMVCDNQWYLESKFSLQQMASRLATNENYVSKAINIGLQKNFNRMVNEARVKHAQELLNQDHCQSILSVAYDSGFSAKASFNRAFKDIIGMTPTQYVTQKKT